MPPTVYPKFQYKMFVLSDEMGELSGQFVYASMQLVKRGDNVFRLLHADDRQRLCDKFNLMELMDEANYFTRLGGLILVPVQFLSETSIPDGL